MTRPDRFTPGKDPVAIVQEVGRAQGSDWTGAVYLTACGGSKEKETKVTIRTRFYVCFTCYRSHWWVHGGRGEAPAEIARGK